MSCLPGTAHISLSRGVRAGGSGTHSWTFNDGDPVTLNSNWRMQSTMHFRVVRREDKPAQERFRVSTVSYAHALMDTSDRELLAAHWHPESPLSPVPFPHYHFYDALLSANGVFLARAHVPSERVSLEAFVRLLIEAGAEPACDDWRDRLDETETIFRRYRSWPPPEPVEL